MTHWIQVSALLPLAAALAVLMAGLVSLLRKPGSACGGPRSAWDWLSWRLFQRPGCGYDLTGLLIEEGRVRCPECGTVQAPVAPRRGRLAPPVIAACLLLVSALACWRITWIRYGRWAPYLPTWVLAELDYLPMPGRVESVMEARLAKGSIGHWQRHRVAKVAIHHLGEDKRDRNASWAREVLYLIGRDADPMLEAALSDADYQRRQCAAELLRERATVREWEVGPHEAPVVSDRLIAVSVEAFQNDRFERSNAMSSFRFLLQYRERVLPLLEAAIRSRDKQQAFLGAVLAGFLKAEDLAPLAAPLLVEHLRDNSFEGDARTAAPALLCLGEAGRPYLLVAIDGNDGQARELAWAIARTLDHQPLSTAQKDMIKMVTMRYQDLGLASVRPEVTWNYYGRF